MRFWEEILLKIDIPLKLIHVTRNPFDNFATILLRHQYGNTLNWTAMFKSPVSISLLPFDELRISEFQVLLVKCSSHCLKLPNFISSKTLLYAHDNFL